MLRHTLLVLVCLILFAGCSPPPPATTSELPAPSVPPAPAVTPEPPISTLPTEPLWPRPGAYLADEGGHGISYAYSPFSFKGQIIVPVRTPQAPILVTRKNDDVYLVGTKSLFRGIVFLPEPQLLYHLPLTAGQTWKITFHWDSAKPTYTYKVAAITEDDTPVGRLPVVILSVSNGSRYVETETWAPGYGLVRLSALGERPYVAARLVQKEPERLETVGQPAPDLTALLVSTGQDQVIVDTQDKELGRIKLVGIREGVRWQRVGTEDFVLNESPVSGTEVIWRFYAYHGGGFKRVQWQSPDGTEPSLPVYIDGEDGSLNVDFPPDGTVVWRHAGKTYVYRWDPQTLTFRTR